MKSNEKYWNEICNFTKNFQCCNKSEQVYLYLNQTAPHKCVCGNPTPFNSIPTGYQEFCSNKCPYKQKIAQLRGMQTQIQQGGIGLANPIHKAKQINTLIKNHGIINPGQLEKHKTAMKTDNPMFLNETKQKLRDNCIKQHGVSWHSQRPEIIKKKITKNIEIYGCDNASQKNITKQNLSILQSKKKMKILFEDNSIH